MSLLAYFKKLFDTHPDVPWVPPRAPLMEVEKVAELRRGQRAEVKGAYGIVTNWDLDNAFMRRVWVKTLHDDITRAYDAKNVRVVPVDVTIPVISSVTITEAEFAQ